LTRTVARSTAWVDDWGFQQHPYLVRELAASSNRDTVISANVNGGTWTGRVRLKRDTRQWAFAVVSPGGSNFYGVVIDLTTGAVTSTIDLGTVTGKTNTVTSLGDGWYQIDLTLTVSTNTNILHYSGPSASATPSIANGRPTYQGVTTEGVLMSEQQFIAPSTLSYVATDARGRFFISDPVRGRITIALRTARQSGMKPAAGCRIRMPNIFWSSSNARDWTTPSQSEFRYGMSSNRGVIDVVRANVDWISSTNIMFSLRFQDSGLVFISSSGDGVISGCIIDNVAIGVDRDWQRNAYQLTILNNMQVTNCRFVCDNAVGPTIGNSSSVSIVNSEVFIFPADFRLERTSANNTAAILTNLTNLTLDGLKIIGGRVTVTNSTALTILNTEYADACVGVSSSLGTAVFALDSVSNSTISGFSAFGQIANVNPTSSLFTGANLTTNLTIANIGTKAAPYNAGSGGTQMQAIFTGRVQELVMRRVYTTALGASPLQGVNPFLTSALLLENVETGLSTQAYTQMGSVISRGNRWAVSTTPSAAFGVHWDDAFVTDTHGRLTLLANDTQIETTGQFSSAIAFRGSNAQGTFFMPSLNDTATWELPHYSLGHTGIAQFTAGASATNSWVFTGTNPQAHEFTYRFDPGTGFGASKWMLSMARQSSGGTAGTTTVTVNSTDWNALTRKPAVGDFVQGTSANVPAGTTITAVSGQTLTLSASITTTFGSASTLFFWRDIAQETIIPSAGFKFRVVCRINQALADNAISFLRIPTDTTVDAQANTYPVTNLLVRNLQPSSRVKVKRVDTGAFLGTKTSGSGTTVEFEITFAGMVEIEARNASGTPAFKPWTTQVPISLSSLQIVTALQESDS
jgi:hypothetical protein